MTARRPMPRFLSLLAATGAVLAFVISPSAAGAERVDASVRMVDSSFTPQTVTVRPGELVVWFNAGVRAHTVTSDSGTQLNSGRIAPGAEWAARFPQAGTFAYHSAFLRDDMRGVVVVAGKRTRIAPSTVNTSSTQPLVVTLGDEIRARLASVTLGQPLLVGRASDPTDWWTQALVFAAGVVTAVVITRLLALRRRHAGE